MRLSLVIGTLMTLVMAPSVQAQQFDRVGNVKATGTSYYIFAPAGEATVQVLMLGSVGSPGVYEVGEQTNLGQLLALAGGTGLGPLTSGQERRVTVRLLREEEGRRSLIYEAPWENMLAEPVQYPVLRDGDVLMVETVLVNQSNKFSVRDGLQVLTALSTIALLIERLARISN